MRMWVMENVEEMLRRLVQGCVWPLERVLGPV